MGNNDYLEELAAQQLLLDSLNDAVINGINFMQICLIFPPEKRVDAAKAFKRLGYKEAAGILESLTGTPSLKRLWE